MIEKPKVAAMLGRRKPIAALALAVSVGACARPNAVLPSLSDVSTTAPSSHLKEAHPEHLVELKPKRRSQIETPLLECSGTEEPRRCATLLKIDLDLQSGDLGSAESELTSLLGRSCFEQVELETNPPASPLKWLQRLVLARLLLLKGSLSYGAGDQNNELALRLLEIDPQIAAFDGLGVRHRLDLARSYLSLGEGEKARELLSDLVGEQGAYPEVLASYGIALLSTGSVEESLSPLRRARDLDREQPERHLVLGTALMLTGDLESAARSFRGALHAATEAKLSDAERNEIVARAYGDLGAVLLIQGDVDGGRRYLLKASNLFPRRPTYLVNLAYAELLLDRPVEAERLALSATRRDPNLASAWLNLGLAQTRLKKLQQARDAFRKAQDLDPDDPRAENNLKDLDALEARQSERNMPQH